MPIYIKDDPTAELVAQLATLQGIAKQNAVKCAVRAELDCITQATPLRDRFAALSTNYPLPPATGLPADKAFFDNLSE